MTLYAQVVSGQSGEVAVLADSPDGTLRFPVHVAWDSTMAEKSGYPHFMLKEIHEQPESVANTIRGRAQAETGEVSLPETNLTAERVAQMAALAREMGREVATLADVRARFGAVPAALPA